jgi:hypothetical protein
MIGTLAAGDTREVHNARMYTWAHLIDPVVCIWNEIILHVLYQLEIGMRDGI